MAFGTWTSTVTIELGGQTRHFARITTTRDAASYLIERWPGFRDSAYKEAVLTCTKALRGEVADQTAFSSFLRAATASRLRHLSGPVVMPDEFERAIMIAAKDALDDELRELAVQRASQQPPGAAAHRDHGGHSDALSAVTLPVI
ncbi:MULTISPECIES: DUF982 domain-containing protein [unclassified Rhizobium]|uniref:DUF982 domain-containing protein n=1 Tax=unclassified Rhizobium TaxID=2613769 RepID=UPI001AE44BD6|nr:MULTISPECIES: DUF982 domain-containing protein [unclassified Rhizobium]MBP2460161.1 hypothetical protein [Rhizobium sp. PvP014]MBP2531520.1 hypothetical protein [Rhizobium sp. PvP099]